jgi:hypothetical protein
VPVASALGTPTFLPAMIAALVSCAPFVVRSARHARRWIRRPVVRGQLETLDGLTDGSAVRISAPTRPAPRAGES